MKLQAIPTHSQYFEGKKCKYWEKHLTLFFAGTVSSKFVFDRDLKNKRLRNTVLDVGLVSVLFLTHVVEKRRAGKAKMVLPTQMNRMVAKTTDLDVRTLRGQTMALYLK